MMYRLLITGFLFLFSLSSAKAQCFASAGNPVGGTANMGVMDDNMFRLASFYRYSFYDKYFQNSSLYTGQNGILKSANYNYLGWLAGYGITKKLTIETEGGYYFNKTQVYKINNQKLTGKGLSNIVISLKPRLYYNADKRFEISCGLGANIPFSRTMQEVKGVTLPIDIQPSTGSYGIVFQSFIIKENSYKAVRFFLVSRMEKYFENKQSFLFGNFYSNSFYFSKHFIFETMKLKDWTLILQLRNQIKERNIRSGNTVNASGNCIFFLGPQINLSLGDFWNISVLTDIPVYQNYNEIQLGNKVSFALNIIRDFSFNKKQKNM